MDDRDRTGHLNISNQEEKVDPSGPLRTPMEQSLAERQGFEPLDTLLAYTHFPGERLRPLGHRSAYRWKDRALDEGSAFRKRGWRGFLGIIAFASRRRRPCVAGVYWLLSTNFSDRLRAFLGMSRRLSETRASSLGFKPRLVRLGHPAEHEPTLRVAQLNHDRRHRQFLARAVHDPPAEREIFLPGRQFAPFGRLGQIEEQFRFIAVGDEAEIDRPLRRPEIPERGSGERSGEGKGDRAHRPVAGRITPRPPLRSVVIIKLLRRRGLAIRNGRGLAEHRNGGRFRDRLGRRFGSGRFGLGRRRFGRTQETGSGTGGFGPGGLRNGGGREPRPAVTRVRPQPPQSPSEPAPETSCACTRRSGPGGLHGQWRYRERRNALRTWGRIGSCCRP